MTPAWTIVAPATAPVAGGVGILRLSGPGALRVGRRLARGLPAQVVPRHAYLVDLEDGHGGVLDQGLFLYFEAPHSFTGEEVVELQGHGSPRLLGLLQRAALGEEGVRLAEPGEFTRRAFLNGRIDLARAEAVADLVAAGSEAAARAAAAQVHGALSEAVRGLRGPLLALQAELEGELGFPDEAESTPNVEARLGEVAGGLAQLLGTAARGRLVREGARVVLLGPVNAGKSTLFNALLGEERALVDEEPGTTRDALEARVEWGGMAVSVFDTAGLRAQAGRVEALGISRTRGLVGTADLVVCVTPQGASAEERAGWREEAAGRGSLEVFSKADLGPVPEGVLRVSALRGEGVEALRAAMAARLWTEETPGAVWLTSHRHQEALSRAQVAVGRAAVACRASTLEVVAGEVGLAVEALGEVTGENASDELLDAIFRRFCIGK